MSIRINGVLYRYANTAASSSKDSALIGLLWILGGDSFINVLNDSHLQPRLKTTDLVILIKLKILYSVVLLLKA